MAEKNFHRTNYTLTSKVVVFSLLIIILINHVQHASGKKKGCAHFGHACFGGHGKRAENSNFPLKDDIFRKSVLPSTQHADISISLNNDM
ncbi:hypothetical protein NPIL_614051 [Nephila pilipes]|uniref:Uncharacterized protein n=1 Tax=Nephila pilipes TaxID=299642 RepID=A0A8X6PA28_NEPPI|nr:hypothetical protein NPIL_614051 [Nephila pilipes]